MRKDTVVTPSRSVLIKNVPVLLYCKCRAEVSEHPTERCRQFTGDHVEVLREEN